jgi:hypothetical protein
MPEGFAFPINHRVWVPLPVRPSGYAPLEGAPVRIFGRIAQGATQERANDEVAAITDRVRAASPRTHEHLRPRVIAYWGGKHLATAPRSSNSSSAMVPSCSCSSSRA